MNNYSTWTLLPSRDDLLDPYARVFYHHGLKTLSASHIPFLVGGPTL